MKKNSKSVRRNIIEWALLLGIPLVLYLGGWHTEVIGRIQGAMLYTGILRPNLKLPAEQQLPTSLNVYMRNPQGEIVLLNQFRGKVIFLNFWATWCPPCRAEMPHIQALYEKYADDPRYAFVMLSLDDNPEKIKEYIGNSAYTFPVFQAVGSIPAELSSATIPTTFVISANGRIVMRQDGMSQYNTPGFRRFMQDLADQINSED